MTPFVDKVHAYFQGVHRDVFADDPAANPYLSVEIVGAGLADDTPVCVLIAPWTLCGLAAPPDARLPSALRIRNRHYPALSNEVDPIGSYWSVLLVPDVSHYAHQDELRVVAESLAVDFQKAVEKARRELTQVADRDRRLLLKGGSTRAGAVAVETAFGDPNGTKPQNDGA